MINAFWYLCGMIRVLQIGCLALFASTAPAAALTGAELLQSERDFAHGYMFSAVEYRISVISDPDERFMKFRACVRATKANAQTLYDLVAAYIRRTPSALSNPAVGAVIQALSEVCPQESR